MKKNMGRKTKPLKNKKLLGISTPDFPNGF